MPKKLPTYRTRRRWTAAEGRAALDALAKSGFSIPAFADREKLDEQRLRFWRKRLGAAKKRMRRRPAFLEVRPREPERVEIVLRSGRTLRAATSIGRDALAMLVDVLDGAC